MITEKETYMGAITWKGEVMEYMHERLKQFPALLKLSKNKRVIDNIHREYMSLIADGMTKADRVSGGGDYIQWDKQTYRMASIIADRLNVPKLLVINFFIALYNLASQGKIPFQKWDPKGFQEAKELQKTLPTEKSVFTKSGEVVGKFGKRLVPIAVIGGIIGGYLLYQSTLKQEGRRYG